MNQNNAPLLPLDNTQSKHLPCTYEYEHPSEKSKAYGGPSHLNPGASSSSPSSSNIIQSSNVPRSISNVNNPPPYKQDSSAALSNT